MTRRKTKSKRLRITKGERLLTVLLILIVVSIPIVNVFTKALLSESNIELERIKDKVEKQENLNESLNMQINELASFDKIQQLASELGLEYINDNIKVIQPDTE